MANKRIKKKMAKTNTIQAIHNAQVKLQEIEAEAGINAQNIKAQSGQSSPSGQLNQRKINGRQRTLESLIKQLNNIQNTIDKNEEELKTRWKKTVGVKREVGKKKYTEGQKNYIRALKIIEKALDKPAADIKAVYGSDDIEELANQYYIAELRNYTQEELVEIEKEFNKTHGYRVRLENATNPFENIDFNTLMPN